MNLSPYPIHTKQTRTNNNIPSQHNYDFFRPIISNPSIPISYNHENYIQDNNYMNINVQHNMIDLERNSICTRNNNSNIKQPAQLSFQQDYYSKNFETLNHENIQEVNKFLTRNPVDSRRDDLEKTRNIEKQDFLKIQGGNLNNFTNFKVEYTRKSKNEINSSNYIPMPRTMAIPKENI